MSDREKFKKLVEEFGNLSFDCGEWAENTANEPYEIVRKRCSKAEKELLSFFESFVSGKG